MSRSRKYALATQHALSDAEIREIVERLPEGQRPAMEGWLRGERTLDGDRLGSDAGDGS